jgi:hypothetical protein
MPTRGVQWKKHHTVARDSWDGLRPTEYRLRSLEPAPPSTEEEIVFLWVNPSTHRV